MAARIRTLSFEGRATHDIEVSCELTPGMSRLVIKGLPDETAEECRHRVQSTIAATGMALPSRRMAVSLIPEVNGGDVSHHDLPIALAIMASLGLIDSARLDGWIVIGRFDPNGRIEPPPHIDRVVQAAKVADRGLICGPLQAASANDVPVLSSATLHGLLVQLKRPAGAAETGDHAASIPGRTAPRGQGRTAPRADRRRAEIAPKPLRKPLWKRLSALFDRAKTAPADEEQDTPKAAAGSPSSLYNEACVPEPSVVREVQASYDFTPDTRVPVSRPGIALPLDNRDAATDRDDTARRSQLHTRLVREDPAGLSDQDVLEFILFGARGVNDAGGQARLLLQRFGSLSGVLHADPTALRSVRGVGDQAIGVIRINAVAARRMAREEVRAKPVLANWDALIDYLALDMMHLTRERVRVLYLDHRQQLVKDEHISEGTLDEASVHPREVIHHALDCGATSLIMVHNHPSGSPEPSRADIQLTHRVAAAGKPVEVSVADHVIVGQGSYVSLRKRGLL